MNVLILKDNYKGVYNSFDEFYKVIIDMFINNHIHIFIANTIDEAIYCLTNKRINFTLNIGQYHFYKDQKPLYDLYEVINYQWIIDNPLRYDNCDYYSKYNRMIFIDNSFKLFIQNNRSDYLTLPIPFKTQTRRCQNKIDAIFAPIKIKSKSFFENLIDKSKEKELILDFLDKYDFDSSFGEFYCNYRETHQIINEKEFFEIVNGYIRIQKRLKSISSIKKHMVIIASNNPDNLIFSKNVVFINPLNYNKIISTSKKYKYILNCNPNFDYCIHDRVSYSIMEGTIVISDANKLLKEIDMPLLYNYSETNIDDIIDSITDYDLLLSKQVFALSNFSSSIICSKIIENYNRFNFKSGD